jgi:hypothetical protein
MQQFSPTANDRSRIGSFGLATGTPHEHRDRCLVLPDRAILSSGGLPNGGAAAEVKGRGEVVRVPGGALPGFDPDLALISLLALILPAVAAPRLRACIRVADGRRPDPGETLRRAAPNDPLATVSTR